MRIGIDAREIGGMPTGVGRYLFHLIEAWTQEPAARAHEFLCYLPAQPAAPIATSKPECARHDGCKEPAIFAATHDLIPRNPIML